MKRPTHIDENGRAKMVDVGEKEMVKRMAVAKGKIVLQPATVKLIKNLEVKKGDVLTVAKIAGIMGAKKTSELIPLTHQINLENIDIKFKINNNSVEIISEVKTSAQTGVEMEALTAVCVSALTIYDMLKAVDKNMVISDIYLVEKKKQ